MGGSGRTDETCIKILVDEGPESRELNQRQSVESSQRWRGTFFKVDLQVVVAMRGKFRGLCLTEHICIIVILQRDNVQVQWSRGGGRTSLC